MRKVFDFYSDPGHGWAKVYFRELKELGLVGQITECSYQRGVFVYLEEDSDLSLFIDTYEKILGVKPKFNEHTTNKRSKIRRYSRYTAGVSLVTSLSAC